MIDFKGRTYRDDRLYVINITCGNVEEAGKKKTRWVMETYKNVASLPSVRTDDFGSKEAATDYLKTIEPETPLISNGGSSLDIPDGVDRWEFWTNWLKIMGYQSAITGFQHVPDRVRRSSRVPKRNDYVTVVKSGPDDFE